MKLIRFFKNFFQARPPSSSLAEMDIPLLSDEEKYLPPNFDRNDNPQDHADINHAITKFSREKIRFDNLFRIFISTGTILICIGLSVGGIIPRIGDLLILFGAYGTSQLVCSIFLTKDRYLRLLDYVMCGLDLVTLSIAVHLTGGYSSPLYFLYFVPLMIQAYHHDFSLLVFYGLGGVSLYTTVITLGAKNWAPADILEFGARIFFILVTVGISILLFISSEKKIDPNTFDFLECAA